MDGLMFYFTSWSLWIYITFIMRKENPYRLKLAAGILMTIILAGFHVPIRGIGIDIQAGALFSLIFSYSFLMGEKKRSIFYFLICSYIVTLGYATFHIVEVFDPVLVIVKENWMIAVLSTYLILLLQGTLKGRIILLISGTMQGEILYALIVERYPFPYQAGSFAYLDVCALTAALLIGWSCLENARLYFDTYFTYNEKDKQKTS